MSERERYGYAESRDSETWDGIDGGTREEAAAKALDLVEGDVVYICRRQPLEKWSILRAVLSRTVEMILEAAGEDGYELAPWWDASIFDETPLAVEDFEGRLHAAGAAWLRDHPGPDVWQAEDITEHHRVVVMQE